MPGTNKDSDPWLHRLGPIRTTRYQLVTHSEETHTIVDNYKDIDGSHEPLPSAWTGETIFDYLPEDETKPTSTSVELDGDSMTQLQKSVDHWTKDGAYWTRHHVCGRYSLFVPSNSPDGPDVRHLHEERTTTLKFEDKTISHKDNWKVDRDKRQDKIWTGTTVFQERSVFPQVMLDDLTESALAPKQAARPHEPSKEERELHELTHLPFRAWCAVCVKTRGAGDYHRQVYDKKPLIQVDYAFMTHQQSKKTAVSVLTATDVTSGMTMAAVVPGKGATDYNVSELSRFIHEVGRTKGMLQSDQEPSVQTLLRRVSARLGVSIRTSPAYSSGSLGNAERFHRQLWALLRTMREQVKIDYDIDIELDHPLMTWMVKHASWLQNRFQLHSDGNTSYFRRWEKDYVKPLVKFAETLLFKLPKTDGGKTEPQWDKGIWLGRCTTSDENFIGTTTEVIRCRTLRRLPPSEMADRELLIKVKGVPWSPRGLQDPELAVPELNVSLPLKPVTPLFTVVR